MSEILFERIEMADRAILVTTKTRFYGFFTRPRTYVVPEGFSGPLGFQARYNTCDPKILEQLHRFWIEQVAFGRFETLLAGSKQGFIEFPPEFEHLRPYLIGFNS